MQSTSDEVLIGRIANGDRLAMQVLFARYHVRAFRFVVRLVRDKATPEDVISEVFSTCGVRLAGSKGARRYRHGYLRSRASWPFRRSGVDRTRSWTRRPQPRSKICR